MANDFFTPSGAPSTGSSLSSAVIRAVFTALQASFDKMPSLTSTGGRLVRVNPGSTALEAMTLTPGAILYGGGNNEVVQGNNFAWNAANNTLGVNGNVAVDGGSIRVSGIGISLLASSLVMAWSAGTGSLTGVGNSNANRSQFQVGLRTADGNNAIIPLFIDSGGNTTLNNLNATQVGVTNLNATVGVSTPVVGTDGAVNLGLKSNNSVKWNIGTAGTLFPATGSGLQDIGNTIGRINTLYAVNLNVNGAAALTNLNATDIGATNLNATGRVQTPSVDSVVGTLLLKGAGSTAATITNANVAFAGSIDVATTATVNALNFNGNVSGTNLNITGALRGTSVMLSPLNNSLIANINLNNTSAYIDGPSVAQGNNGTWYVSGTVTFDNPLGPSFVGVKLWDGTSVIASTQVNTGGFTESADLSGFITNPVGNLRISAKSANVNTIMNFNTTGSGKDSTITAIRIG